MDEFEDMQSAYRASLRGYWSRLSRISALVALVLVPAGITVDYALYPDQVKSFFFLRVLCSLIIGVLFFTYYSPLGKKLYREITFVWLLVIQAMICYMIVMTEGAVSPYYAGLNLSVLAVGIFLPTTVYETIFFAVATLLFYIASVVPFDVYGEEIRIVYNNMYFLLLTSVITSFASFFGGRRRFEEFRLNFELDRRNQKLAELDRTKSEFFANISHELRTPLTLILSPVQDILESQSQLSDRVASALSMVRNNALRLLKLVNDLLDVIRLEEGKFELEKAPIAIDPLVAGISDSMSYLAEMQEIELRTSLTATDQLVLGDYAALEKVFINILNNAIKFCGKGGVVEVVSEKSGDAVLVTVSDTGIGIDSKDLPFIFDRFRQADGSTTRRYQGTGLGLALVKEIVERHAGRLRVSSEIGKGTAMKVELPIHELGENERVAQLIDAPFSIGLQRLHRLAELNTGLTIDCNDEWEQKRDGGSRDDRLPSVLVVDDEPDMRHYLVAMLKNDYRVYQADNGLEGLKFAQNERPDLLVLDLMLPKMDGLEVCRKLKTQDATRSIKIILLTARIDEEAKLTALDNGADDFITKPFSRVEVRSRLANLYGTARLERDLGRRNEELSKALSNLKTTQAQLIHSEKLNALGSLAAGLLHEINNPLNYSLTALQLIRTDAGIQENELLSDVIGDIDEGMQRIRAIVTDLRSFAYPSEAETRMPFKFKEIVESALRFTSHELKNIDVVLDVRPNDIVLGSKNHITQVLVNILLNSAKAIKAAARKSGGQILVSGGKREGRLEVRVSDNGTGMDEGTLDRIFDPFFTTQDVGEGMGLGLSICHTIVANHGGRLVAHSEPGNGAELIFDLPLAEAAPIDAA